MNKNTLKQLQVLIEQLKTSKDHQEISQTALNLQKYSIKSEPDAMFDDKYVGSDPCQEDTGKEICKTVIDWAISGQTGTIFWLIGLAGMGKSTIAQTIARHFKASGQLGATYFFKRPGRSKADRFVPTLANALVISIPSLKKYIYKSLEDEESPLGKVEIEGKDIATQFRILITNPLKMLSQEEPVIWTRVVIIDALDECENKDILSICNLLSELHKLNKVRFRILLTSRDELPIRPVVKKFENENFACSLSLLNFLEESKRDIHAYLNTCLTNIKNDHEISEDPWPSPDQFDKLFTLASTPSPLFIYVATLYRSLNRTTIESAQTQLKNWLTNKHQSSQLAKTYGTVMESVLFSRDEDLKQFKPIPVDIKEQLKKTLSAVILLATPLSSSCIANLLDLNRDVVENCIKNLQAVLYIETEHGTVRILHTSFRDYLLHEARSGDLHFSVDEKQLTKCWRKPV